MINSQKNVFLSETEIKPNKAAMLVMKVLLCGCAFCWILNEIGIFRVGKLEMRIGSIVPIIFICSILLLEKTNKKFIELPITKWLIFFVCFIFTAVISTLLTFHTTIMLLFPMFIAMLYRSVSLGTASLVASVFCTMVSPVAGYLLKTWDIPLFEELIGIGTGGTVIIENVTYETTFLSIGKIFLYIVMPRFIMVGSCSCLMFHVIRLGREHVDNQIQLDNINRRDFLTGCYNQNYYKQIVSQKNEPQTIGVIFFDVNGLKLANDKFGHEYGDLLLKRCADSINSVCDFENVHGFRIGGDEFLIIAENADEFEIAKIKAKWESNLARINQENITRYDGMLCSMAYGSQIGNINDLEELVHRADALMYHKKELMKAENQG